MRNAAEEIEKARELRHIEEVETLGSEDGHGNADRCLSK
jgi:hypothetical protein